MPEHLTVLETVGKNAVCRCVCGALIRIPVRDVGSNRSGCGGCGITEAKPTIRRRRWVDDEPEVFEPEVFEFPRYPAMSLEWILKRTRLTETGCLEWCRGVSSTGYGKTYHRGKNYAMHIVMYRIFKGEVPQGLCVLHHCDNRQCCHPDHLFLGTHADNTQDALKKGRVAFAKLDVSQVLEIRLRLRAGESRVKLAREFNVHVTTVGRIDKRQTWSHVV
jgi:hypothetical protein